MRMVVPFGPGTSTDITARIFAQGLSRQLKQTIVVGNKPGAGGNIGTELVTKAAPNGYTLSFGTAGMPAPITKQLLEASERARAEGHWIGNQTMHHKVPLGEAAENSARKRARAVTPIPIRRSDRRGG